MPDAISIPRKLLAWLDLRPWITADEFESQYAARCGQSVEWLREHGRVVRPCDCDYEGCEGWQSVGQQIADDMDEDARVFGFER